MEGKGLRSLLASPLGLILVRRAASFLGGSSSSPPPGLKFGLAKMRILWAKRGGRKTPFTLASLSTWRGRGTHSQRGILTRPCASKVIQPGRYLRPDWTKEVLATKIRKVPAIGGDFTMAVALEFTKGLCPDKLSEPSQGASQELFVPG